MPNLLRPRSQVKLESQILRLALYILMVSWNLVMVSADSFAGSFFIWIQFRKAARLASFSNFKAYDPITCLPYIQLVCAKYRCYLINVVSCIIHGKCLLPIKFDGSISTLNAVDPMRTRSICSVSLEIGGLGMDMEGGGSVSLTFENK